MRLLNALLGLLALLAGAPAAATISPYTLTGTLSGSQTTIVCPLIGGPSCIETNPFTQDFGVVVILDLGAGSNPFSFGSPYSGPGLFQGTIVNNGALSGFDLTFGQSSCGPGTPGVGCINRSGSAATFTVQAGAVPEPATWAMLLLGFALVGLFLRTSSKRRPVAKPLHG
jgi:hypothetical protein